MNLWFAKAAILLASIVMVVIRAPYGKRSSATPVLKSRKGPLEIALLTLASTLVIGVPAAFALYTRGDRWARLVEEIVTLPLAIPGLAIALALVLVYAPFGAFRRSSLFILAGHVVFTLPFMLRAVMAVLASLDMRSLDESAASLGLAGEETFSIGGVSEADEKTGELEVRADDKVFRVSVRIQTPTETAYFRHGGILPYVLRALRGQGGV